MPQDDMLNRSIGRYADLPEFLAVVAMGKSALPFVMEKIGAGDFRTNDAARLVTKVNVLAALRDDPQAKSWGPETREPITGATLPASSGTATEVGNCLFDFGHGGHDAGPGNCRAIASPGKYHLTVRATGYVEATLEVEAERDVCGRLTSQDREVGLQRIGSTAQPLVDSSEKCGG